MLGKSSENNKKNHAITNNSHNEPWVSIKRRGDLHKKGCYCSFTLKQFYIHPIITKICYATFQHVNKEGLVVHGFVKSGLKSTFSIHVLEDI
jgi:hypothetical protein